MKRTNVQLTLVFVHRDERYRAKVSDWLTFHARSVGVELDIRHANALDGARRLLGAADRVLVDGDELTTSRAVNRGEDALPIFALVQHLDAVGAYNFLNRGVIAVGRCESELDAAFLAYTLIEGAMVAKTPDAQGRYVSEKEIEHRATITRALFQHDFNVRATARYLGMPHTTLQSQMKKFGMTRPRGR